MGLINLLAQLRKSKSSPRESSSPVTATPEDVTSVISRKAVMAGISSPRKTPQEDAEDQGHWWCFAGHPNFDPTYENLPYDRVTVDQAILHLNRKIAAGELPVFSIPNQILEVFRLLDGPDFEYREITAIIEKNPSLAAMFIASINSSLFNRGFSITELYPALLRLGKNNIRALLQIYAIKISFASDRRFGEIARQIIRHSYATAIIASFLTQRYFPEPGLAFLAGLLHDIGKLAILKELSLDPRFCLRLKENATESMFNPIFAERHEKIGLELGREWHMDELTLTAIARHHRFWEYDFAEEDQLDYHLCLLINLSDTIARILGYGRPIGKTNLFLEPAVVDLNIEKNLGTIDFLADLPELVNTKVAGAML
ncbi:MAG: HDOD domain-containing protein [Victivallales bacterium]|nr:HDOD domain-containing protein [Victivallales bacterium]